jgi:hypothetical protein
MRDTSERDTRRPSDTDQLIDAARSLVEVREDPTSSSATVAGPTTRLRPTRSYTTLRDATDAIAILGDPASTRVLLFGQLVEARAEIHGDGFTTSRAKSCPRRGPVTPTCRLLACSSQTQQGAPPVKRGSDVSLDRVVGESQRHSLRMRLADAEDAAQRRFTQAHLSGEVGDVETDRCQRLDSLR